MRNNVEFDLSNLKNLQCRNLLEIYDVQDEEDLELRIFTEYFS